MENRSEENLWKKNTPQNFWKLRAGLDDYVWQQAVKKSLFILDDLDQGITADNYLEKILGEGYLEDKRWRLSPLKTFYYQIKPLVPRKIKTVARKFLAGGEIKQKRVNWPVEDRYARFMWHVLKEALIEAQLKTVDMLYFWPEGKQFAFVLTHDVETDKGLNNIGKLIDIEQSLGFYSNINIIPERYPVDPQIIQHLLQAGCEIGIHGLHHDGKLYKNFRGFSERMIKINGYMQKYASAGFRSPLMHRNAYWLQLLKADYDMSFFDTDPYEAMPGGILSIWPFEMGNLIELPYTLVQDFTLFNLLDQNTPDLWLKKIEFLRAYNGMALLNVHPDYMVGPDKLVLYETFLKEVKSMGGYWHALPGEITGWWKTRSEIGMENLGKDKRFSIKKVTLTDEGISIQ